MKIYIQILCKHISKLCKMLFKWYRTNSFVFMKNKSRIFDIVSANYGFLLCYSNRADEISMCHFMEVYFELKNTFVLHWGS